MVHNLFITHAWRYHDAWNEVIKILDNNPTFEWRNFSVPWYDPALQPHDQDEYAQIYDWLESQIKPVDSVLFLGDVYAVKNTHQWLEIELKIAEQYEKPIIFLLEKNGNPFPLNLSKDKFFKIIPFNAADMFAAIIEVGDKLISA